MSRKLISRRLGAPPAQVPSLDCVLPGDMFVSLSLSLSLFSLFLPSELTSFAFNRVSLFQILSG